MESESENESEETSSERVSRQEMVTIYIRVLRRMRARAARKDEKSASSRF